MIANGDVQKAEFVLNWCADIVQNPTRKPGVAIVLRGREGTGKSVLGGILRRLLGARNVVVNADKDRLLGRFNSALASKILIQAEESSSQVTSRTADALKHLITGQTLEIEIKFGRNFEINSPHRLLITSNHVQVIQASSEARRFVVCDVSDARRGDADYFDHLYAVADGRDETTARAFMRYLQERDLSNFQPWAAQQRFLGDKALVDQKALTLSPPLAWLREVLEAVDGERAPSENTSWHEGKPGGGKWMPRFSRSVAIGAFRDWTMAAKPYGASAYTGSEQRFWSEITRVIRGVSPRSRTPTATDMWPSRSTTPAPASVATCREKPMTSLTANMAIGAAAPAGRASDAAVHQTAISSALRQLRQLRQVYLFKCSGALGGTSNDGKYGGPSLLLALLSACLRQFAQGRQGNLRNE